MKDNLFDIDYKYISEQVNKNTEAVIEALDAIREEHEKETKRQKRISTWIQVISVLIAVAAIVVSILLEAKR